VQTQYEMLRSLRYATRPSARRTQRPLHPTVNQRVHLLFLGSINCNSVKLSVSASSRRSFSQGHDVVGSDAVDKSEQISQADTAAYNTLISTCAENGDFEQAILLLQRMKLDYESGSNKNHLLDTHTYSTVLKALQKSNLADAVEKAEQIVNAMPLPDTATYNILLNIYARKGKSKRAFKLVNQMKSDFESGKNRNCPPDTLTYQTTLNALTKTSRSDAVEEGEQMFNAMNSPETNAYNMLFVIYSNNNKAREAVALMQRMQSVYDTGNTNCVPSLGAKRIVKGLLDNAKKDFELQREARSVMEWFIKPRPLYKPVPEKV
jgi:pentatricopeptide repeat protein